MADNLTPEECDKLWDWLVETLPVGQVAVFTVRNETTTIHTVQGKCGVAWWILNDDAVPEKLRRALAVKGMTDSMSFDSESGVPFLSLITQEDLTTVLEVEWHPCIDKTKKHVLMQATLNLIGGTKCSVIET